MKKPRKHLVWIWLTLAIVAIALFTPAMFAGADTNEAAAKGQYTWLPECLE